MTDLPRTGLRLRRAVALAAALALVGGGYATASRRAPVATRTVEIVSPREGAAVRSSVRLVVRTAGFTLHKPNGDASGQTGHLHAFIDRKKLPPAEQIIPEHARTFDFWTARATLTGLKPGRHTILVVATDGYRVPFRPQVWDRVSVNVR